MCGCELEGCGEGCGEPAMDGEDACYLCLVEGDHL